MNLNWLGLSCNHFKGHEKNIYKCPLVTLVGRRPPLRDSFSSAAITWREEGVRGHEGTETHGRRNSKDSLRPLLVDQETWTYLLRGQQCTSCEEAGGMMCKAGFQANFSSLSRLSIKRGSSNHDTSSLTSFNKRGNQDHSSWVFFPRLNYTLGTESGFEPGALSSKCRVALQPGYSQCSPWTNDLRVTWERVRKMQDLRPPENLLNQAQHFNRSPENWYVCQSL